MFTPKNPELVVISWTVLPAVGDPAGWWVPQKSHLTEVPSALPTRKPSLKDWAGVPGTTTV